MGEWKPSSRLNSSPRDRIKQDLKKNKGKLKYSDDFIDEFVQLFPETELSLGVDVPTMIYTNAELVIIMIAQRLAPAFMAGQGMDANQMERITKLRHLQMRWRQIERWNDENR